jgi:hypothetical protein
VQRISLLLSFGLYAWPWGSRELFGARCGELLAIGAALQQLELAEQLVLGALQLLSLAAELGALAGRVSGGDRVEAGLDALDRLGIHAIHDRLRLGHALVTGVGLAIAPSGAREQQPAISGDAGQHDGTISEPQGPGHPKRRVTQHTGRATARRGRAVSTDAHVYGETSKSGTRPKGRS